MAPGFVQFLTHEARSGGCQARSLSTRAPVHGRRDRFATIDELCWPKISVTLRGRADPRLPLPAPPHASKTRMIIEAAQLGTHGIFVHSTRGNRGRVFSVCRDPIIATK